MSHRILLERSNAGSRGRAGFALPLAIVVLALLTMGLVAGFAMTSTEMSTTSAQRAQARAYSYAQMGLESFLVRRKEIGPANDTVCRHCWQMNSTNPLLPTTARTLDTIPTRRETTFVRFSNGMAIVRATPVTVNLALGTGTYFVTSTGFDSSSTIGGLGGRTKPASRTVGVFVTWNKTTINVVGAWTSLAGIVKNGTGEISGNDQCGGTSNVAGIYIPAEASVTVNGGWSPTGSPPYDTMQTLAATKAAIKLDWLGIRGGSAIPADIVIPGGAFPTTAQFAADTNYWPIIHVTSASFTLPNAGRGMLIVDHDLSINGSNQWSGVILVGGQLVSNGNNVSAGTTLSGLNYLLGGTPAASTSTTASTDTSAAAATANGQKSYIYNSCSVAAATSRFARYTMMPNTWMDNIAGF
ncbi:MAG: pilus assembly PilX N-terminal domain-containing protein [Gemmatimonadaceae bacterium]|nr:pilus assembly PilX N-terminal domain-containing protein [Gemmatimonadaceae bacterium]